jgi:hypothetical protein
MIQPSPTLGRQADPGDPAQTGTPEPQTEKGPKQADSPKSRKPRAVIAVDYSQDITAIIRYQKINVRAMCEVKRLGFKIREAELQVLLSLMPYCMACPSGIVNIVSFIDQWHRSRNQSRVFGGFFGLINSGYVQIFEQRSNGSRFVGVTAYGEKLITIYYQKVSELIASIVFRKKRISFNESVRFARIDPANVGTLYIKGMTTKYRHLYDRSKYFNADGSIKN